MERLQIRWLGRVPYADAYALQRGLFTAGPESRADHLLLLEHSPTYTLGVRADRANIVTDADALRARGAEIVETDRGGDVTFHGPGQLVGYPILTVAGKRGGGMADTVAFVTGIERLIIDTLADVGLPGAGRLGRFPGVWVDPDGPNPRKIAAVGVKVSRARSMHGFALNVTNEPLGWFADIVPCGIADKGVTSLEAEGIDVPMRHVVDALVARVARDRPVDRADVVWRRPADRDTSDLAPFSRGSGPGGAPVRMLGRLAQAGVDSSTAVGTAERKPDWLRVKADMGPEFQALKRTMRSLDLVTVCEEAGCPNIHECWNEGTATFMVLGERCTRACGFCLVDTRLPLPPDPDEPYRVAEAVSRMNLLHTVVTMVARDDLADGGAAHVAATVRAIRDRNPDTRVEVLISDHKGDGNALETVFTARPDVLNHNMETVARLQRAVRPSAGYARSLSVLARAKAHGLTVKSGIMVGLGETFDEVRMALRDLRAVGVEIVTVGQYLRPTMHHLPVDRWWEPAEFDDIGRFAQTLGFAHVEASPLTRSSYHARQGAEAAALAVAPTAVSVRSGG